MSAEGTVGQLRNQTAFQDAATPVVLVTQNERLAALVKNLKVIRFYPDTTNGSGDWGSTFKIEVDYDVPEQRS